VRRRPFFHQGKSVFPRGRKIDESDGSTFSALLVTRSGTIGRFGYQSFFAHHNLLDLHQVDTRLLPHGGFPCPGPNPKDVAARPTPRCRQRESGSVSWSSKLRGPASTPGCRNPSDPGHYHDHSEPHIRSSSAAQDGPGSPARREGAKDSELPEPRSYEFCVDDLYNFVRPHGALKFGRAMRTRAQ
jgi:hypothetical protein